MERLLKENLDKGVDFYQATYSTTKQLYFFACPNHFASKSDVKDIKRYHYCKDINTPAYEGSYNKQPAKWIDKYYIIRGCLTKLEEIAAKKRNKNQ